MGEQRVARDVTVRFAEHGSSKELGARETFDAVNQEEQKAKEEEEEEEEQKATEQHRERRSQRYGFQ